MILKLSDCVRNLKMYEEKFLQFLILDIVDQLPFLVKMILNINFFLFLKKIKLLSNQERSRRFLLETFLFWLLLGRFTVLGICTFIQ